MEEKFINTVLISLLVFTSLLWNGCKLNTKQDLEEAKTKENNQLVELENPYKDAEITVVVIPSENNTFGYDIFVYDAVIIHQPSRPGLQGNLGFTSKEDALRVAELVIKKIRNNEMPPTVFIQELQELGVL